MLKMITPYFTNRTQQVEVNGHVSELRKTSLGVPQGSILGPLFFFLYVNDLSSISNVVKFFQFADDTVIVIEGDCYDSIQAKINTLIPKLTSWFPCNKLLNPCKTYYQMYSIFANQEDVINNSIIKRQFSVKGNVPPSTWGF